MDWTEAPYNLSEIEKKAVVSYLSVVDIEFAPLGFKFPHHTLPNNAGAVDHIAVDLVGRKGTSGDDYKARQKRLRCKTDVERDVVGAVVKIGWTGSRGQSAEDTFFLNDGATKRYIVDALDNPKETFLNCLRMLDGLTPYAPAADVVLVGRRMS